MADFTAYNNRIIEQALRKKTASATVGTDKAAFEILERTASAIHDWVVANNYTYQDQTYNLSDSIGYAIYKNGVLVKMITPLPPRRATSERKNIFKGAVRYINGRQLLEEAISSAELANQGQYVLGVYVAAPYGISVDLSLGRGGNNKRGKGWFSGPNGLKTFAEQKFNEIKHELINSK